MIWAMKTNPTISQIAALGILIMLVATVFPALLGHWTQFDWRDLNHWSELGQACGIAGSVIAAFAFLGFLYSVRQQNRQIAETKEELNRTLKAQEQIASALKQEIGVMVLTAHREALVARIEAYNAQIDTHRDHGTQSKLITERHSMIAALDTVLEKARKGHGKS